MARSLHSATLVTWFESVNELVRGKNCPSGSADTFPPSCHFLFRTIRFKRSLTTFRVYHLLYECILLFIIRLPLQTAMLRRPAIVPAGNIPSTFHCTQDLPLLMFSINRNCPSFFHSLMPGTSFHGGAANVRWMQAPSLQYTVSLEAQSKQSGTTSCCFVIGHLLKSMHCHRMSAGAANEGQGAYKNVHSKGNADNNCGQSFCSLSSSARDSKHLMEG